MDAAAEDLIVVPPPPALAPVLDNGTAPVDPPIDPDVPTAEDEQIFLALLVVLLAICFTLADHVNQRYRYLTESSFACLVGLAGGLLLLLANVARSDEAWRLSLSFSPELFFDWVSRALRSCVRSSFTLRGTVI